MKDRTGQAGVGDGFRKVTTLAAMVIVPSHMIVLRHGWLIRKRVAVVIALGHVRLDPELLAAVGIAGQVIEVSIHVSIGQLHAVRGHLCKTEAAPQRSGCMGCFEVMARE